MISVLSFGFLYPIKWQINIVQPWKSKVLMLLQLKHKEKPILKTGNKAPCCGICICVLFLHSNFVFVFVSGHWMKQTKRLVEDLSYKCFVLNCTCLWNSQNGACFCKSSLKYQNIEKQMWVVKSEYLYKKSVYVSVYNLLVPFLCGLHIRVFNVCVRVHVSVSKCWRALLRAQLCLYVYIFKIFLYLCT